MSSRRPAGPMTAAGLRRVGLFAGIGPLLPLAAGCAGPPEPRTYEERIVEMQMTVMAQQTVADYLRAEGVRPEQVRLGEPTRTRAGWAFPVWRADDPQARTVVRVAESAEVASDDLAPLRPAPESAAEIDDRFRPVERFENPAAARPDRSGSER